MQYTSPKNPKISTYITLYPKACKTLYPNKTIPKITFHIHITKNSKTTLQLLTHVVSIFCIWILIGIYPHCHMQYNWIVKFEASFRSIIYFLPAVFFFKALQLIVCYSWIIFRDKGMEVLVEWCAGYWFWEIKLLATHVNRVNVFNLKK